MKSSYRAIVPDESMKWVRIMCQNGPDFHRIMDCVGSPDFDGSILNRSPSFTLSVRLCNEGHENGDTWAGWTGSTHDYEVNLVIVSLTRKPKGILALRGHIKEEVLSCGVSLYDDPTFKIDYPIHGRRRAYIDIARGSYLKVLDLGRRSGYFD